MARPRKIVESTSESTDDVKSSTEFQTTRVYDPTAWYVRETDAFSQEELDRLLAGGWLIKTE